MRDCGLALPDRSCADAGSENDDRQSVAPPICRTAAALQGSASLDRASAGRVWPYLGHEHQLVYQVEDLLAMPASMLSFMFEHPDVAARWLSRVAEEPFTASSGEAGGQRWIDGAHGERFRGRALVLAGSSQAGRLILLGYGQAKLWRWEFRGKTVFDIEYQPSRHAGHTRIRVRVYAAPGPDWLYQAMDSAVFRAVATRFARGVLNDIEAAASRDVWTAAERQLWQAWRQERG